MSTYALPAIAVFRHPLPVQHLSATLGAVPTQHKRVSVTLTPPLREALECLRRRGLSPTVGELAMAGAHTLLADAEGQDEQRRKGVMLRKRLATRLRTSEGIDTDALAEVRREGWARP